MVRHPTSPVIELQVGHRAIRRYTGEPIPGELLAGLIRAGQGAASSSFIQAYSIIRITRRTARTAIARTAGNQPWIERAAEFLLFCADLRRVDAACRHAGAGALEGWRAGGLEGWTEHGLAAVVDVALMAQKVLLAAQSVGLGGVYIGGIRNDPQTVVEQLQIPELVVPAFGLCLGWPAESTEVKPRQPLELILHQDVYRDAEQECLADHDRTMADHYTAPGNRARRSDWSTTTAKATQGKKRGHRLPWLRRILFFKC
jgi:nitroreductase